MVRVWPSARKSKLLSAALKVRTIEPEPEPALTIVAESAPASAAAWVGGVAPPDQSIEDTLVVTSLTLKPVKVSTPGDAVSRLPLPVARGISVIPCPESPAFSSGLGGVIGGSGGLGSETSGMNGWVIWGGVGGGGGAGGTLVWGGKSD